MLRAITKQQSARAGDEGEIPDWLREDLDAILVWCRLDGTHELGDVVEEIIEQADKDSGEQ